MGKKRAIMGNIGGMGMLPVLTAMHQKNWTGVLRLRQSQRIGAIWLTNGSVVHALLLDGKARTEGPAAFRVMAAWSTGTFLRETGLLPPARSIRESMESLLALVRAHVTETEAPAPAAYENAAAGLSSVLESLRARVPGLESISVTRGARVEATTVQNAAERTRLDHALQEHFIENRQEPETLYLQQGGHSILIVRSGGLAAVLAARTGTTPEALFWAGEEAQRQMQLKS